MTYQIIEGGLVPIKAWIDGVELEAQARAQLLNVARLPIVHGHIAAMPDVHWGIGATVGSVIPTVGAIIAAAVGVDIGCGMVAQRLTLRAEDLPDTLDGVRVAIEQAVPHGFAKGGRETGSWREVSARAGQVWATLEAGLKALLAKYPDLGRTRAVQQLGTLGSGNHFIELCLDESGDVWILLHSGSRGIGNRIGTFFIELARRDMETVVGTLPDRDLAYLTEGTEHFADYVAAVGWAQDYARQNRELMRVAILEAVRAAIKKPFEAAEVAVNCHHNYVQRERHFGAEVWLTRKGAVRAGQGELGIIPGSMGAKSFIVEGRGNPESFESCSHGAGRRMSRGAAKKAITLEQHLADTAGVACRKDAAVLDESPRAYKDIDAVMAAQDDLVRVVHTLKQVVCVKG